MRMRFPLFAGIALLSSSLAAYAAAGTISPRADMDATYVKQQLQQLGYQDVDKVQHLGGIFDVLASQDGKPVDLRIDSRTGRIFNLSSARSIMPLPGMTPGYVRQQLADRGYTDLSGVHRIGDTVESDAPAYS